MISLADPKRIISGGVDDFLHVIAPIRVDKERTHRLIGACIVLFAGSVLLGQQAQFQGSVSTGVASPTPIALTLRDAIDRGLRTNLGLLLSAQASETARGERLRSLRRPPAEIDRCYQREC